MAADDPDPLDPLERLVAVEEIRRLKARYCRFADEQDWVGFRSLFLDDARCTYNAGTFEDPDAMVDVFRDMVVGGTTVHLCHQAEIDVVGPDEATAVWAFTDRVLLPPGAPAGSWTGSGWYHETYRRVDGRWRIARLRVVRSHLEALP